MNKKENTLKYNYIIEKLLEINPVDEEHGIIELSDINGLEFYGLVEEIRTALKKRVDVLDIDQLKENFESIKEILKDGIKIYG